jgi:phage terminase large subunit-like protein
MMGKRDSSNKAWIEFKPGHPIKYDPFQGADDFYLDRQAGQEAIDFFPACLCHVKGEKALEPLILEVWQQSIIGHLFGWKHKKTHLRRYREAFIFIPRKNGKSCIVSGISLFFLFCQPERGQEVYCCASDRSQARIVFDTAKMMLLKDDELSKRAECLRSEVRYPQRDSVFRVLSSEAGSKHGYSSNLVIFDELHAIDDRELIDVLVTSTGSRREPLVVSITTAGFDQQSICFEKYDYGKKVRDNVIKDDAFFPCIYEAEEGADWTSPEVWKAVNPNYSISIGEEYLTREAERAKESPAYEAVFKRLHLNQWTEAESPYIALSDWDKCGGEIPDLTGRKCYGGLDLSRSDDLTAFSLCFPPTEEDPLYSFLVWSWIPEEAVRKQRRKPYFQWVQAGHLIRIPGAVIEYSFVIEKIDQLAKEYDISGIMFDRWGAVAVRQELESRGMVMIEHGQGFKDMSPPTKELLRLVLSGKICHSDHPVLRWCVSNLVVETDAAGNVKPSKKRSAEKIDLIVAAIMALQGVILNPVEPEEPSVYEERGLLLY